MLRSRSRLFRVYGSGLSADAECFLAPISEAEEVGRFNTLSGVGSRHKRVLQSRSRPYSVHGSGLNVDTDCVLAPITGATEVGRF